MKLTRSSNLILLTSHFFHAGGCRRAFTIASGNRAGNSEDDEDDLAEIESSAKKKTTKLALDATTKAKEETTKLASDATTKNIALCDGDQGGSLPCSRVEPNKGKKTGNKPSVSTPAPLFLASLCLLPFMPPCDTLAETCLAGMSRRPQQGQVLSTEWW